MKDQREEHVDEWRPASASAHDGKCAVPTPTGLEICSHDWCTLCRSEICFNTLPQTVLISPPGTRTVSSRIERRLYTLARPALMDNLLSDQLPLPTGACAPVCLSILFRFYQNAICPLAYTADIPSSTISIFPSSGSTLGKCPLSESHGWVYSMIFPPP